MKSALALDRLFSFWTHEAEYALSGEMADRQLLVLADRCINRLLPAELFSGDAVQDMKGCGPQQLLGNVEASADRESPEEELLYAAGKVRLDTDHGSHMAPFHLQLATKFDRFIGYHHISHTIIERREGPFPPALGFRHIASVPDLRLDRFRIALELFHAVFTGRMGVAPIGDQRLFLEADRQRFEMILGAEHLNHMTDLPLAKDGYFDRLQAIFSDLFEFDIRADYLRLIQKPTRSFGSPGAKV